MSVKLTEHDRNYIVSRGQAILWEDESQDTAEARDYLLNTRNISEETLKKFRFGYVPRRARHDWSERIIMPLFDPYGKLVVVTSRKFRTTDQKQFPHLHEEFNKKFFLYGIDVAKEAIINKGKIILVEGQIDTTHMHSVGFNMTAGILGSAFTLEHLSVIRRYCNEVYLMFDHDEAGLKTLKRSMLTVDKYDIRETFNMEFIPVLLPIGNKKKEDPDGFLNSHSARDMRDILSQAKIERIQFSIEDIDRKIKHYAISKAAKRSTSSI